MLAAGARATSESVTAVARPRSSRATVDPHADPRSSLSCGAEFHFHFRFFSFVVWAPVQLFITFIDK